MCSSSNHTSARNPFLQMEPLIFENQTAATAWLSQSSLTAARIAQHAWAIDPLRPATDVTKAQLPCCRRCAKNIVAQMRNCTRVSNGSAKSFAFNSSKCRTMLVKDLPGQPVVDDPHSVVIGGTGVAGAHDIIGGPGVAGAHAHK